MATPHLVSREDIDGRAFTIHRITMIRRTRGIAYRGSRLTYRVDGKTVSQAAYETAHRDAQGTEGAEVLDAILAGEY